MSNRVCVVTGSRAEYGLLSPLLAALRADDAFQLQLLVTGSHLSPEFGLTYREIEADGYTIDEKVEVVLSSDTPVGICKSMGLGLISFSEAFSRLNPDLIVVLGDRYEIFSAVSAAHISRIPVAHLHGGEVTEGAFDDALRHSITKMSHLHFTSTEAYRKRVIQLGEAPERVFNVGAIGLDNLQRLSLLSREKLEQDLGFKFNKHNLLCTFHPVTLEHNSSLEQVQSLLNVLEQQPDTNVIFTKTNADTDGRIINQLIDEFVAKQPDRFHAYVSLGQLRYLSMMQFVDAVVGNSSSGIIEAPGFRIGTINIGNRQTGRIKSELVIDCEPTETGIASAFKTLYSSDFQKSRLQATNPYGEGQTTSQIISILKENFPGRTTQKSFYDLD
ncbi:UDP-N-acetylglucosamine 2-epimerase [Gimesia panareensis]|uniref:GDP/UDP-N,N'-diacetylbacillosamine 2-epimerase (Hydrolyzing) n=1 Tax=Gimesia panareensis TaxID=2527978 RepID=A0A517Q847_9PLAN|nr:UDP-N-acetylglucosamine 2-epimerase [Gimesia panareensis]QDT27796.1 GDP/UDP-N,N'-diacetylbacillosamine 2-epimerase (hydrolyzing) [Gimesia panareensis]QDU49384.1 GDP/UDP-N,N'-diacetylbacillosamine 2-epimerase (hydrolyzing) [Gimesia panareensis]